MHTRLSTIPGFAKQQYGVYAELVSAPEQALVKHPAALSWPEAASIWMQYLTACGPLVRLGDLRTGDTVIITRCLEQRRPLCPVACQGPNGSHRSVELLGSPTGPDGLT